VLMESEEECDQSSDAPVEETIDLQDGHSAKRGDKGRPTQKYQLETKVQPCVRAIMDSKNLSEPGWLLEEERHHERQNKGTQ
jgi:hypothetical protein